MTLKFLTFLICFMFYGSFVFCHEIDLQKFLIETENEILEIDKSKELLCDSFDIYTYYYLNGKIAGILEARRVLNECKIKHQSLP
jgi:hypothetical protein